MLIWENPMVLRTCPQCKGEGATETETCKRCGGEGVIIDRDAWEGPFPEDSAHAEKRPETEKRGDN